MNQIIRDRDELNDSKIIATKWKPFRITKRYLFYYFFFLFFFHLRTKEEIIQANSNRHRDARYRTKVAYESPRSLPEP